MKTFLMWLLLVGVIPSSFALEGVIFHVSRKLRLEKEEPIAPKEFYIDLGEKQGVQIGDIFKVYREMVMVDDKTGDASSLMRVELGDLKVIFVGDYDAIGRIERVVDPKQLPNLDYSSILLGDRVVGKDKLPTPE